MKMTEEQTKTEVTLNAEWMADSGLNQTVEYNKAPDVISHEDSANSFQAFLENWPTAEWRSGDRWSFASDEDFQAAQLAWLDSLNFKGAARILTDDGWSEIRLECENGRFVWVSDEAQAKCGSLEVSGATVAEAFEAACQAWANHTVEWSVPGFAEDY